MESEREEQILSTLNSLYHQWADFSGYMQLFLHMTKMLKIYFPKVFSEDSMVDFLTLAITDRQTDLQLSPKGF